MASECCPWCRILVGHFNKPSNGRNLRVSWLDKTDVNFCLRSLGSIGLSPADVAQTSSGFNNSITLLRDDVAISGETLPEVDTNPVFSEAILTFVPESEPAANIGDVAEEPVGSSSTPSAEWLTYLNHFRAMAGLADLVENDELTFGSQAHARYMVINDKPIAHSERSDNPLFTAEGLRAAQNGNIFSTTQVNAGHEWATNFWISAPFHLIRIIDPALSQVGYGDYNEAVGNFHMSAVLDVSTMLGEVPDSQNYPIYFPGEGAVTEIVRHSLYEWPDPVDSCAGYTRPTGPPLIIQLGDGSLTPSVSGFTLAVDGVLVPACAFSETTYTNPDQYAQANGRFLLGERDAVVILPRNPLQAGKTYTATVFANGQTFSWSFSAAD